MPYEIYKVLHFVAIFLMLISFGGIGIALKTNNESTKKQIAIAHGVGLLLILVAGFGLLARQSIPISSGWIIGKLVIWAIFGALPVLARKVEFVGQQIWWISLSLATVAVYLVMYRPF